VIKHQTVTSCDAYLGQYCKQAATGQIGATLVDGHHERKLTGKGERQEGTGERERARGKDNSSTMKSGTVMRSRLPVGPGTWLPAAPPLPACSTPHPDSHTMSSVTTDYCEANLT